MTKFNSNKPKVEYVTQEGGSAYKKRSVSNFFEFAFGNLLDNGFYESADDRVNRLNELTHDVIDQYGAAFAAKTALYARNTIGIRSASEYIAAILNDYQFDGKRQFYTDFFRRPDDIGEVFSAVDSVKGKRSHALIYGAGKFLSKQSAYSLGKYKMNGKDYNLHDIINLTHAYSESLDKFQKGELESPETWEVKISGAGSEENRNAEWLRLLSEGKLGYLALLRNVRNLLAAIETSDTPRTYLNILVAQLTNETAIRKSLVFPYQIYSCYKNIDVKNIDVVKALNDAFRISVSNMPELDGNNLYILDVSGSMSDPISSKSNISIKEASAVYCVAAFLAGKGDFLKFGNECKKIELSRLDNPFEIVNKMTANDNCGFGTALSSVFDWLDSNKHPEYDRYFIFSDFQTLDYDPNYYYWISDNRKHKSVKQTINDYLKKHKSHWYSLDLGTYNTTVFNPWNKYVHGLTSLSDKIFSMIPLIESGEQGMVDYISQNVKL